VFELVSGFRDVVDFLHPRLSTLSGLPVSAALISSFDGE